MTEDIVTPWDVQAASDSGIDYDKLLLKFGCFKVDQTLISYFEKVTKKKAHHLLKRGIFFAERDLFLILKRQETGQPFFLYTGRGPSTGSMHLGHLIPFLFTKWLQDVFDAPVVLQLTDDEKYLMKSLDLDESRYLAKENAKDIMAVGFNPDKTFIFNDFEYMYQCKEFYQNIVRIGRCATYNQIKAVFGFQPCDSIGKIFFPSVEIAPCLASSFPNMFKGSKISEIPCLIPCAIDQDPYFRVARDVMPKLNSAKPTMIYSTFFPALQGPVSKMSSSNMNSAIFLTDTAKEVEEKVMNLTYSKDDGNCDMDVSFQYLTFLLEDEDHLQRLKEDYENHKICANDLRSVLLKVATKIVLDHQKRRTELNEDFLQHVGINKYKNDSECNGKMNGGDPVQEKEISFLKEMREVHLNAGNNFGTCAVTSDLIKKLELICNVTAHHQLRRGIAAVQRNLDSMLNCLQAGQPLYLYIGHEIMLEAFNVGHLAHLQFVKWLQETFNLPLIVQLSDDELVLRTNCTAEKAKNTVLDYVKDIIAVGFRSDKTFIFNNFTYINTCPEFYMNIVQMMRAITFSQIKEAFGFDDSDSIGKISFPAVEYTACISSSFPKLLHSSKIPAQCCAIGLIEHDKFYGLARNTIGDKLKHCKPFTLLCHHFPSLQSVATKMTSTDAFGSILLTDTADQIKKKVNKYAFSGGGASKQEHEEKGGNCDIDVSFQFLRFFLPDDVQLQQIHDEYAAGRMYTGDLKKTAISLLQAEIQKFQDVRKGISKEDVEKYMTSRNILS